MRDRVPTRVLPNGAIRFGEYDASGNLLGYKYIRREDEPTEAGTPNNKANLMPDALATKLGLNPATATVAKGIEAASIFALKRTIIYDQTMPSADFIVDVSSIDFSNARTIVVELYKVGNSQSSTKSSYVYINDAASNTLATSAAAMTPAGSEGYILHSFDFCIKTWGARAVYSAFGTVSSSGYLVNAGEMFAKANIKKIRIKTDYLTTPITNAMAVIWYA